jgi:hypothetical protein
MTRCDIKVVPKLSMAYFELRTPRDMLEKARREHQRLLKHFNIDNVFNFFVTAYHIRDYIIETKAVRQVYLERFLKDQDLKDCHDLCDKAKHLVLKKRPNPSAHIWSGEFGGAPLGVLPFGGDGEWVLSIDGRDVDVELLADRVMRKWDIFFSEYDL